MNKEETDIIKSYDIAYNKQLKKYCPQCKNTNLQKERECCILNGGSSYGCHYITKHLQDKFRKRNREYLRSKIKDFIDYRDDKNNMIKESTSYY